MSAVDGLAGRTVLVTGAAGFLGSHLVRRLIREGADVHAIVRRSGGWRLAETASQITEWVADVTDASAMLDCAKRTRPEIVVHLAGETAARRFIPGDWSAVERSIAVNLMGTLNLVRAAVEVPSVRALVRAGGLAEYGNGPSPFEERQREEPLSPYSASQVASTHFCQMLQRHTEVAIVTLRPALVYGPAQAEDFFIPAVISAALRGEDFPMSSGVQRRDLLFVDDVVDAFVRAASLDGLKGAIFNVGSGDAVDMRGVAELIVALVGGRTHLIVGALQDQAAEALDLHADAHLSGLQLGWKPSTSLREGLDRTIDWYRRHEVAQ